MTKFGKICCKNETFHQIFHNLNDFYHIILFLQLLFFGIICFWLQNYKNIFLLPLSFSFTHSFFLRKVRSAAGAAHPFTQKTQFAQFTHTSQYAPFTHGAQTAQTTVEERFPIKGYSALSSLSVLIRHYPSLSVTIRHYPALSGNRYSKKQYLCTRNRAGTLGDKQNVQAVCHGPRHSFSVPPPFILRSISVLLSFDIRSTFVFSPFHNGKQTEKNGKKRRANESEAKKKRRSSKITAN